MLRIRNALAQAHAAARGNSRRFTSHGLKSGKNLLRVRRSPAQLWIAAPSLGAGKRTAGGAEALLAFVLLAFALLACWPKSRLPVSPGWSRRGPPRSLRPAESLGDSRVAGRNWAKISCGIVNLLWDCGSPRQAWARGSAQRAAQKRCSHSCCSHSRCSLAGRRAGYRSRRGGLGEARPARCGPQNPSEIHESRAEIGQNLLRDRKSPVGSSISAPSPECGRG